MVKKEIESLTPEENQFWKPMRSCKAKNKKLRLLHGCLFKYRKLVFDIIISSYYSYPHTIPLSWPRVKNWSRFSLEVQVKNTRLDVSRWWSIVQTWTSHPRQWFWPTELPIPTFAMPNLQKKKKQFLTKIGMQIFCWNPAPEWSVFSPKVEEENTKVDVSRRWSIVQTWKSHPRQ